MENFYIKAYSTFGEIELYTFSLEIGKKCLERLV